MKPYNAYKLLLRRFGRQGWWPVSPRKPAGPRYRPGRFLPASEAERLEIALGAILTQNTAWENARRALVALGTKGLLTNPSKILAAPRARLQSLVRSAGYYVQKEKKIRIFCSYLDKNHPEGLGDWLAGKNIRALREELLQLWGIGPETADSILLYAGGRPVFVVDAYTLRLGKRLGWFGDLTYPQAQTFFAGSLPRSVPVYNELHALVVALCKEYCRKKPLCAECPLRGGCAKNISEA